MRELYRRLCLFLTASIVFPASAGAASLSASFCKLEIDPGTGALRLEDKRAGMKWQSQTDRFGQVTLKVNGKPQTISLRNPVTETAGMEMKLRFQPLTNSTGLLQVRIALSEKERAVHFSYEADPDLAVDSVKLLDDAFWATGDGYVVVPVREGLLIPANSGLAFTQRFDTYAYEGCHMEMAGIVQDGAAALLTWTDPYAALDVRSATTSSSGQVVSSSLNLRKTANSFSVRLLGRGDYAAIAAAYRQIAKARGLLVTWDEKLKGHPERAKYLGASNYKLWSLLDRRMDDQSAKEKSVRVNWTFDEAAQVAEHLKNDLKMEKVLFSMGGWIHRGYDNEHPDILPTAPECGGDAAFTEACKRINALGYVLTLHDNYQDIYANSPSFNEKWVQKNADGSLVKGGNWAGGRAYITCSKAALELAQRPQNLTAVKKLSAAESYFIDTTYAAGLQECFDPNHPLTRADDIKWKQALSDYGRGVFGSFGSECGREWAIPHADYFEGLTGVSGSYYHNKDLIKNVGGHVVPLFEMVYRDCIAAYGKYGYDPRKAAEYVLHHIAIGRPLNYHIIPPHLYWKTPPAERKSAPAPGVMDPALFVRGDQGWAEGLHPIDRFVKNTHEILSPLNELTARSPMTGHQFLTPDRKVQRSVFGRAEATVNEGGADYTVRSKLGGDVVLPPGGFLIESPNFAAFCATAWRGQKYSLPALFTLRSLDKEPLEKSRKIKIFHGFGDPLLSVGNGTEIILREAILEKKL